VDGEKAVFLWGSQDKVHCSGRGVKKGADCLPKCTQGFHGTFSPGFAINTMSEETVPERETRTDRQPTKRNSK